MGLSETSLGMQGQLSDSSCNDLGSQSTAGQKPQEQHGPGNERTVYVRGQGSLREWDVQGHSCTANDCSPRRLLLFCSRARQTGLDPLGLIALAVLTVTAIEIKTVQPQRPDGHHQVVGLVPRAGPGQLLGLILGLLQSRFGRSLKRWPQRP